MNELSSNFSSFISPQIPSHFLYFSPNLIDLHHPIVSNQTLSLLQFNHLWILPLFILSLFGILFTIIFLFLFLYFSIRRLNDHSILTNLFLCFSVCFLYIIVIFFLVRGNELFCGLREFLSQFAYALLFSALLCRYIMQWLSTRILSKRTKQLTALLLYSLLVCTQIPIGILWWYFTIPRFCQYQTRHESPRLKFHFHKRVFATKSCAYQCTVDYRFYATYTYIILELFLCTIIAISLFFYRCCHRREKSNDQFIKINRNYQILDTFLNMFALILIDIAWLFWTFIYHFTQAIFVFPALVIGMFTIATIGLFFILLPQIYFYSKSPIKDIHIPRILLFTNKLATSEDGKDEDLLLQEKSIDRWNQNKQQILYNGSEVSYELGASGTFLPITRTPKGLSKVMKVERTAPIEKLDQLIYGEQPDNRNRSTKNERKRNAPETDVSKAPLQRQFTSNTLATDLVNSNLRTDHFPRSHSNIHPPSTSMYYSSCTPPYRDETLIPILCSSQHHPPSTPVKMRILVKSSSSSVPTTRRIHSGADHRYVHQNPYHRFSPSPSPVSPLYYSPSMQQSYLLSNPYQISHRYPYPYRRFHIDNRSLSQRLWDIDSGDDEDEIEGHISYRQGRTSPTKQRLQDFRSSHIRNNGYEDDLYQNRKPAFV